MPFQINPNGSAVDVRIRISPARTACKIHLPRTSESSVKKFATASCHGGGAKLFPKAQVTIGPWLKTGFTTTLTIQSHLQKGSESHPERDGLSIGTTGDSGRSKPRRGGARIKEINEPYKLEILRH